MTPDVTDFGAVGDGSTDDTQAIRDAADAAGPGGTVYFPSGTYLVGSDSQYPLDYPTDGSWNDLTWRGESWESTTIKIADGKDKVHMAFRMRSDDQPIYNASFLQLTIDGNKAAQNTDIGLAFRSYDGYGTFRMRDCRVTSWGVTGLNFSNDMDAIIEHCRFDNNGYYENGGHAISTNQTAKATAEIEWCLFEGQGGADIDTGTGDQDVDYPTTVVDRCVMRDSPRGSIKVTHSNDETVVKHTQMIANSRTEIPVKMNPTDIPIGKIVLDNCIIDGGKFPGIDLPAPGQLELHDVAIKNVNSNEDRRNGSGIWLDGMDINAGTISVHDVGPNNDGHAITTTGDSSDVYPDVIEEVVYGGTSDPSQWPDEGIVQTATPGDPLEPDVATEDEVGPRSATSGSGELKFHYPFEGSGSIAENVAGGTDATVEGGAERVSGLDGQALELDGSDDFLWVEHHDELELEQGTISLWVKADELSSRRGVFSKDARGSNDAGQFTLGLEWGTPWIRLQATDENYVISGDEPLETGKWYHFLMSWGIGGFQLYIDGELIGSNVTSLGIESNPNPLAIGAYSWATGDGELEPIQYHWDGVIEDVRIYSDQRMPADVPDILPQLLEIGGYVTPAKGTSNWHEPLNENFGSIGSDITLVANRIAEFDGGEGGSSYGDYATPAEGTKAWHRFLNGNFSAIDDEVSELADRLAAIDSGADGSNFGGYATPRPASESWHEPVNDNFVTIENDLLALAQRVNQLG